jgi:hypothetical protein
VFRFTVGKVKGRHQILVIYAGYLEWTPVGDDEISAIPFLDADEVGARLTALREAGDIVGRLRLIPCGPTRSWTSVTSRPDG